MARTSSIVTLARRLETARAKLYAIVESKQQELAQLDGALRRVFGVAGGGAASVNGRARRTTGRRRGRGRAGAGGKPGAGTLGATIVAVLSKAAGKAMGIEEVLKGAKTVGYKSKAAPKTQRIMVNQTLSKLVKGGMVRKVRRGQYAAKS